MSSWKKIILVSLFVAMSIASPPNGRFRKLQITRNFNKNFAPFRVDPLRPSSSSDEVAEDIFSWPRDIGAECDKCPPGYGLVSMCNVTHPTVCQACTLGVTYSAREPHYMPCTLCSKCGDSFYEDMACTTTKDTFCDSCSTSKGSINDDFVLKCSSFKGEELVVDSEDDFDNRVKDYLKVLEDETMQKDKWNSDEDSGEDYFDIVVDENAKLEIKKMMEVVNDELDEEEKLEKIPSNETEFEQKVQENIEGVFKMPIDDNDSDEDSNENDDNVLRPGFSLRDFENNADFQNIANIREGFDFPEDKQSSDPQIKNINFKPSEHSYPYEELVHPDLYRFKQLKKLIWLYGITAVMLVTALMVVTCYAGSYYRRRRAMFARVPTQMTVEDVRIIRETAQRLEQTEKQQMEKRRNPFNIQENPLEEYLDDEPVYRSTETLIPNVHKKTNIHLV